VRSKKPSLVQGIENIHCICLYISNSVGVKFVSIKQKESKKSEKNLKDGKDSESPATLICKISWNTKHINCLGPSIGALSSRVKFGWLEKIS